MSSSQGKYQLALHIDENLKRAHRPSLAFQSKEPLTGVSIDSIVD